MKNTVFYFVVLKQLYIKTYFSFNAEHAVLVFISVL